MNIAVIGCGTIANAAHIPAYLKNKDARIVYFCDIIPERAERAVEQYGCGKAVKDYRDILKDPEITAVSVCTPNNTHAMIAMDMMRAGKHVLCEKPAARSYQEALEMQKAQHETGKLLCIGVVNRFNDGVNRIKALIDSGKCGEIYHVYVSFRAHRSIPGLGGAFTTRAISGGGALIDWGVHFLDIVMYCCGDPAALTVSGETFSKLGKDIRRYVYQSMWAGPPDPGGIYDVEDSVSALIRTAGPAITVHGAWAQNIAQSEMYIDFMGDRAGIRLMYGADFTVYTEENGALIQYTPAFEARNHFETEIGAFIEAVQTGGKPASHIDTVIITAQMMQAIYDSSARRREIVLQ
jgi:predicted dehydrogenase